jgi:hypothetical protein
LKSRKKPTRPNPENFLASTSNLATQFAWPIRTFERDAETVCVASIPTDASFERFVWVYDSERVMLRCMMVGRQIVPERRETNVFELCARINEGLPFGCLEYSLGSRVLVFRDSADLNWGKLNEVIEGTTARTLNLGRRYAKAISLVLDGKKPEDAVREGEADGAATVSAVGRAGR